MEINDGGTTYVHLQDAKGKDLLVCVSDSLDSTIPSGTVFLGGRYPTDAAARLPRSQPEARAAVATLEAAIRDTFPSELKEKLKQPEASFAQVYLDAYSLNHSNPESKEDWWRVFAFQAWLLVSEQSKFDIYNPEKSLEPDWYADFEQQREEHLERIQRQRAADERFAACYPEEARPLLTIESGESDFDQHGRRLAAAVGDPVRLAEISSRAFGTLQNSWSYVTARDRIAIQAARRVSAEEFIEALHQLQDDDTALLGAARMFYDLHYWQALSREEWEQWAPPITEALMQHGDSDNIRVAVRMLGRTEFAGATLLLRRIARGEFGDEEEVRREWDDEPGINEAAYLALATKGDQGVRAEIEAALSKATVKQNVDALQEALDLLGDTN